MRHLLIVLALAPACDDPSDDGQGRLASPIHRDSLATCEQVVFDVCWTLSQCAGVMEYVLQSRADTSDMLTGALNKPDECIRTILSGGFDVESSGYGARPLGCAGREAAPLLGCAEAVEAAACDHPHKPVGGGWYWQGKEREVIAALTNHCQ